MEAPLALYRRYRPDTFDEVIGQSHVTEPLQNALRGNRVHHAYLFSGPRGCGKTTSARIMARCLNCEQGPTPTPCGECDSCRDLARNGPGSIDVIEIDAASHGGVDDTRDLREKAIFAPASSRYKVYIIDEAHMISSQGFNALLKLVEEPPAHLRFIFATTEPEKVIGTIRSRTHHYPFRLVPPRVLTEHLKSLCEREGVAVEPTALPLVVQAGAGSVRDSLSVLDQLMGGAGPEGVTYDLASSLLGYTPHSILDEVVDAFAAADGASVFAAIDKVIETGQDPRRFAEDLLRRLRDLIIVAQVPDAIATGLLEIPEDQAERITGQAARFGAADLTRAAEVVGHGLDEIKGATAPRLLLELICSRVLLPGADDSEAGIHARLDRIERRASIAGTPAEAAPTRPAPSPSPVVESGDREPSPAEPAAEELPAAQVAPEDAPAEPAAPAPTPAAPAAGGLSLVDVRRLWPDVLERVKGIRRFAWMVLSQHAQVAGLEGSTLTLAISNAGARKSFVENDLATIVHQALIDALGVEWRVEAIVDPSAGASGSARPATPPAADPDPQAPVDEGVRNGAREAIRPTRDPSQPREDPAAESDAAASPDDPSIDDPTEHTELLARELGAQVIEEIPHDR